MTISAFNGGDEVCGNTTSGGTESIVLACKVRPTFTAILSPCGHLLWCWCTGLP